MIHREDCHHGMQAHSDDVTEVREAVGLCDCAWTYLVDATCEETALACLAGMAVLQYKNPIATATRDELEFLEACVKVARESVKLVYPGANEQAHEIVTDGILGRLRMGINRA